MDSARLAALLDRAATGDRAAADELFGKPSTHAFPEGELGFRLACAELEYLLDRPEQLADDTVRERYSALVDTNRADPIRFAALRPIGERIHRLETAGVLPRSMVVRPRRRRD